MIYSSGRVLRNLREQTGKTISEVASDLNISYQAMQAYEAGTRLPRYEVKIRIAKYYDRRVGFIFFNEQ